MNAIEYFSAGSVIALALTGTCLGDTPARPRLPGAPANASGDVLLDALVEELGRSMTLELEDLQGPYFVQYAVDDGASYVISASAGAIVGSDGSRSRRLAAEVRVGYYDLDNTNFAGAGRGDGGGRRGRGRGGGGAMGGAALLPLEDDPLAIRQSVWLATDSAYKSAVETLARKQAYLEDVNEPDRPNDFSRTEPTTSIDPEIALELDVVAWEDRLRTLSARLMNHSNVLDAQVSLAANADNRYLLNSEGTRIRRGVQGVVLVMAVEGLAPDGESLRDDRSWHAETAEGLPAQNDLLAAADALALGLDARVEAGVLESYIGPVLFEGRSAPQLFQAMLGRGVAGRADPAGGGRRRAGGAEGLDAYLGKRILPKTFRVYDDPRLETIGDTWLAGHYAIDDEGVPAQRVDLVTEGKLDALVMSRTPTKEFTTSNGHGRSGGMGGARAGIGCLVVESTEGLDESALRAALIEAVRDEGLEYGLRVKSIADAGAGFARRAALAARGGGFAAGGGEQGPLGDPIEVYRVYLDGREEKVRGCAFGSIDVGVLKDIIAAGNVPFVENVGSPGGARASIAAPAVLFEELELFAIEEERQKLPIVQAPRERE